MTMRELTKADWTPYFGNNRNPMVISPITRGGSVSFRKHIGKPLSQELWEDLVHRLHACGLCIYKEGSSEWLLGWGRGHCLIHLDGAGSVFDISWNPYSPPSHIF